MHRTTIRVPEELRSSLKKRGIGYQAAFQYGAELLLQSKEELCDLSELEKEYGFGRQLWEIIKWMSSKYRCVSEREEFIHSLAKEGATQLGVPVVGVETYFWLYVKGKGTERDIKDTCRSEFLNQFKKDD
jgi:hypothetical protein